LPPTTPKKRRTRSSPPLADKLRWAVGKEEEAAKTGRKREGEVGDKRNLSMVGAPSGCFDQAGYFDRHRFNHTV
jgi:hypothetical protein